MRSLETLIRVTGARRKDKKVSMREKSHCCATTESRADWRSPRWGMQITPGNVISVRLGGGSDCCGGVVPLCGSDMRSI